MILLRLLHPQGVVGLALATLLAALLAIQKGETRHWRKQSGQYETLYHQGESALALTAANVRAAAAEAEIADRRNAARVETEQQQITERIADDFQARLADARARAQRLRVEAAIPATDSGDRPGAVVPGVPAASGRIAQAAGETGLSSGDRLFATEQALQLDALIQWVRAQAAVDPNVEAAPEHK